MSWLEVLKTFLGVKYGEFCHLVCFCLELTHSFGKWWISLGWLGSLLKETLNYNLQNEIFSEIFLFYEGRVGWSKMRFF